jgi:hypothetical protein
MSITQVTNRFAAFAISDDERKAPSQQSQQSQHAKPRGAYVPPHMRHTGAPVTQSRFNQPKKTMEADFPSLGGQVTSSPIAKATGWVSKAKEWANYDVATIAQEQERKRKMTEDAQMTRLAMPSYVAKPYYAPGASSYTYQREADVDDDIDAAEAYVGGYEDNRPTNAYYDECSSDQYAQQTEDGEEVYTDGRYTPKYR